jgi:hypothetical protein
VRSIFFKINFSKKRGKFNLFDLPVAHHYESNYTFLDHHFSFAKNKTKIKKILWDVVILRDLVVWKNKKLEF